MNANAMSYTILALLMTCATDALAVSKSLYTRTADSARENIVSTVSIRESEGSISEWKPQRTNEIVLVKRY